MPSTRHGSKNARSSRGNKKTRSSTKADDKADDKVDDVTAKVHIKTEFDEDHYRDLRTTYLEESVGSKTLPHMGMQLRKTKDRPRIERYDGKGWKALRKRIKELEKKEQHSEIYQLLDKLSRFEMKWGAFPMGKQGKNDGEVEEIIDLTDDHEIIEVDTYIIDVLLVAVVKPDPDAPPLVAIKPDPDAPPLVAVKTEHENATTVDIGASPGPNLTLGSEPPLMAVKKEPENEASPGPNLTLGSEPPLIVVKKEPEIETTVLVDKENTDPLEPAFLRDDDNPPGWLVKQAGRILNQIDGEKEDVLLVGSNMPIPRASMDRLKPGIWLDDEVVNCYIALLQNRDEELCKIDSNRKQSHFFKSFFVTTLLNEGHNDLAIEG